MSPIAATRAEMGVLGAIIIDPEAISAVAAIVEPADFGQPRLRLVYEAALGLHARGIAPDYVTLCGELETRGTMAAVGGDHVLTGLINYCPTSLHAEHYARVVAESGAEAAARRRDAVLATYAFPQPGVGGVVD